MSREQLFPTQLTVDHCPLTLTAHSNTYSSIVPFSDEKFTPIENTLRLSARYGLV